MSWITYATSRWHQSPVEIEKGAGFLQADLWAGNLALLLWNGIQCLVRGFQVNSCLVMKFFVITAVLPLSTPSQENLSVALPIIFLFVCPASILITKLPTWTAAQDWGVTPVKVTFSLVRKQQFNFPSSLHYILECCFSHLVGHSSCRC